MNQAMGNPDPQFAHNIADTVRVEFHNASSPYGIAYSFGNINLNTNGTIDIPFVPCSASNLYYLVIKHRNSIETWSNDVLDFRGVGPVSYDFTVGADKAFANNMKLMPDNVYAVCSGDVNQDGLVDGGDMAAIDNANIAIKTGYYPEDVNGDGLVDGSDMAIIDNNSIAIVYVHRPR